MNRAMLTVALAAGKREPPNEAKLFSFGTNETLKGDFILTRNGAQELMARHEAWGVDVMLDFEHMSHKDSATPEQKKAAGWGNLELRDDGVYLTNIKWTDTAADYLKNAEFRYLSPAFKLNDDGEIIELINVALVNMPATMDQEPLVAASRMHLNQEKTMHKLCDHLSAALSKHGGKHEELAKMLGIEHERLTALLSGGAPTHEEMTKCSVTLGVKEEDIEEHSYNGMDVNKTKGNETDTSVDSMHGLFELMGQEAETTPNKPGEASEDQAGTLKMSRAAAETMIQLAADPKRRAEVVDFVMGLKASADRASKDVQMLSTIRATVVKEKREQLIEKHKAKLNPALIALCREMELKKLDVFLSALPNPNKPFDEPEDKGGGSRMVTLSREEKLVFEGEKEDVIQLSKAAAADLRVVTLSRGSETYCGPSDRGDDHRSKTNWDRTYAQHVMHLSIFGTGVDGTPWKPGEGSTFRARGSIVPQ